MPRFNVDEYCPETRIVYQFFGCIYHGHTCQPFRDFANLRGDTLAERYELTMSRLEEITHAGYLVKIEREFQFNDKREAHSATESAADP